MMVLCNAIAVIEYDRRKPGFSSAPQDMEYDYNSIEYRAIVISLNITPTYQSSDNHLLR